MAKKKYILIAAVAFLTFLPARIFAQEKVLPVEIAGDKINYLQEKGEVEIKGHVHLRYKDVEAFCDEATYNANSNVSHMKSNVKIIRKEATIYAENAVYDFNTQIATMQNMKIISPPIYGKAEEAGKEGANKYTLTKSYMTTCDLDNPHYRMVAKKMIAYPGVKVVAKNVILKVGDTPVFYMPYLSLPLKEKDFPFQIIPGSRSDWGYYVLSRYRYRFSSREKGRIIFDWYKKRGVAQGIEHNARTKDFGTIQFNYYHLRDRLYRPDKRDDLFNRYPERNGINPKYLPRDRYKGQIYQDWKPTKELSIKTEFHKFSDENFMKDFFNQEFEIEPHPLSYNLVSYAFSQSSLSLLTQKRFNNFFAETEYLPQLRYDFYQQQLGKSNIYFQSENEAGSLKLKPMHPSIDSEALRANTHNVFNYPKNFLGMLYVNPFIGNYSTFYSRRLSEANSAYRSAADTGIDLSTKLYKIYDSNFSLFGRNYQRIRHVLTPKLSYHYILPPTVRPSQLIQFDSIDGLNRLETVTFTLENKWQARDQDKIWDFIYFSPSVTYQINKKDSRGPLDKLGTYLDTVQSDLEIYPADGVSFKLTTNYDNAAKRFKEGTLDVTFSDPKNKKYTLSVGQRYVREYNYTTKNIIVDSQSEIYDSQTTWDLTYQLTPKLQFKNYLRYRIQDGKFLQQQYSIRRDLHCWWMDLGMSMDKQRLGVTDFTFWVALTLKEFPDLHVGFNQGYKGAKSSY